MAPPLDSLVSFLQHLSSQVFSRLAQILELLRQNQASAGLAAVAAFAISVLFAWRMARLHPSTGGARRKRQEGEQQQPQRGAANSASSSSAFTSQDPSSSASSSTSAFAQASAAGLVAASPGKGISLDSTASRLAISVRKQLSGAQRVTCHVLGSLLRQEQPQELLEGATLIPSAAEAILEVARQADLYLMARVEDDSSEVAILSALEDGGILGPKSPFNSSKLLFCSTETGIMSFVRQLEPDLHIESSPTVVDQLKRFVKRELQITRQAGAGVHAANVVTASSVEDYFGVPEAAT